MKTPLIVGNMYNILGEFYEYVGSYSTIKEVPNRRCIYVIGQSLYRRVIKFPESYVPGKKIHKDANSRLLSIQVADEDNDLMVIVKNLLRNYTVDDFKNLFTDVSEMYNMLRAIENGGDLSWNRFRTMIEKIGLEYSLHVIDGQSQKTE